MHNIKSNSDIIFETINTLKLNDFGADGNVMRRGPKPKLSDLELIRLTLTSEIYVY